MNGTTMKLKPTERSKVNNALRNVGKEFGNESVYEISDRDAAQQRKRAELAAAITKKFINEHKRELQAILNKDNAG